MSFTFSISYTLFVAIAIILVPAFPSEHVSVWRSSSLLFPPLGSEDGKVDRCQFFIVSEVEGISIQRIPGACSKLPREAKLGPGASLKSRSLGYHARDYNLPRRCVWVPAIHSTDLPVAAAAPTAFEGLVVPVMNVPARTSWPAATWRTPVTQISRVG